MAIPTETKKLKCVSLKLSSTTERQDPLKCQHCAHTFIDKGSLAKHMAVSLKQGVLKGFLEPFKKPLTGQDKGLGRNETEKLSLPVKKTRNGV